MTGVGHVRAAAEGSTTSLTIAGERSCALVAPSERPWAALFDLRNMQLDIIDFGRFAAAQRVSAADAASSPGIPMSPPAAAHRLLGIWHCAACWPRPARQLP